MLKVAVPRRACVLLAVHGPEPPPSLSAMRPTAMRPTALGEHKSDDRQFQDVAVADTAEHERAGRDDRVGRACGPADVDGRQFPWPDRDISRVESQKPIRLDPHLSGPPLRP